MPRISVIIPVYNVEKYLTECLDSVLEQTLKDIEVICVNDGSTDNSGQILDEYARQDPRIKVIVQENKGLSGARNTGVKIATGEFTCFVDSDDRIPPFALDTLWQIAQAAKVDVVMSEKRQSQLITQTEPVHWQIHTRVMPDFVNNRHISSSAWNKLYRTKLIQNHPFIEGIYFEDWPFLTTLMGRISAFATTPTPCYIYRENNTSITRSSFNVKKVDSYIKGIQFVYAYFKDSKDLIWAQKRMSVAAKMLINKVYHSGNKELRLYAAQQLKLLFRQKILLKRHLPLKTLIRYLFLSR